MSNKRAQPGDPGQASKVDPKTGNKVEPKTKAKPYGGAGAPGSPDHGEPGQGPGPH